jgi:hypothetical protein
MNRESESLLVGFCVEQHARFDAGDWARFSAVGAVELAAAARYLAGVDWLLKDLHSMLPKSTL